jgi:MFS transporter, SP family, ERD6-like sugar transporter
MYSYRTTYANFTIKFNIQRSSGLTNSDLATCSLGAIQVSNKTLYIFCVTYINLPTTFRQVLATGVTTWLLDRAGRRILLIVTSLPCKIICMSSVI